jgi:hypothetical protein
MLRKLLATMTLLAMLSLVSPAAMAADMTCTRADDNGCTMAKGGNGEEMKVTAPGAKIGDKMNCDEKGTCAKKLMQ